MTVCSHFGLMSHIWFENGDYKDAMKLPFQSIRQGILILCTIGTFFIYCGLMLVTVSGSVGMAIYMITSYLLTTPKIFKFPRVFCCCQKPFVYKSPIFACCGSKIWRTAWRFRKLRHPCFRIFFNENSLRLWVLLRVSRNSKKFIVKLKIKCHYEVYRRLLPVPFKNIKQGTLF